MVNISISCCGLSLLLAAGLCTSVRSEAQPAVPAATRIESGEQTARPAVAALDSHVRGITQDKQGNMWFATDGKGLWRWDGKVFTAFTEKEGLPSDYVRTVQVDGLGNLWITSRDGLCRFDGKTFTKMNGVAKPAAGENSFEAKPPGPDALLFPAGEVGGGGVIVQEGELLRLLELPVDEADIESRRSRPGFDPYGAYVVYRDREGSIWAGTESRGVCKWDGKKFSWLREVDLDKSAVRAIYRDAGGNMWFGNSGVGLFRFDGKELRNFGIDNNIENLSWLQNMPRQMPGRIADPHAIMQDKEGNLWIGVFDSGAWRYDGKNITNFTKKDGLPVDSVSAIYEDRAGKLWFGTLAGVCTWDGKRFERVGPEVSATRSP